MTDNNRPYPEGIAWDEAWRQRQRSEELANVLFDLYKFVLEIQSSRDSSGSVSRAEDLLRTIGYIRHE